MRPPRILTTLLALGTVVALTSACGGGDDDSSSGSKRSTTTTAPSAKADAATTGLATDMALLATDYPAGWKVQTDASTRPVSENHCEYTEDGAYSALPDGAGQNGPIMQLGEHPAFVSSRAWIFPDEAAATQFVETIDAKAWETCQVEALNDFQKKNKTGQQASIETREAEGLGTDGFESFALIKYVDPKAPGDTVGTYSVSVFRFGRVVTMVITEQQFLEPAVQTTFDDQAYQALTKQFARADAAATAG